MKLKEEQARFLVVVRSALMDYAISQGNVNLYVIFTKHEVIELMGWTYVHGMGNSYCSINYYINSINQFLQDNEYRDSAATWLNKMRKQRFVYVSDTYVTSGSASVHNLVKVKF